DVYVRWNTKAQSISLRIREIFKKQAETDYEIYLNALTHQTALNPATEENKGQDKGLLTLIDACVTNAFDVYRRDKFETTVNATKLLDKCNMDGLNSQTIICSNILADSLFLVVNTLDDPKLEDKIRKD